MHTLGDIIRRAAYGLAFTASVGSLWTFAYARHADEDQAYDFGPAVVDPAPAPTDAPPPPPPPAVSR